MRRVGPLFLALLIGGVVAGDVARVLQLVASDLTRQPARRRGAIRRRDVVAGVGAAPGGGAGSSAAPAARRRIAPRRLAGWRVRSDATS